MNRKLIIRLTGTLLLFESIAFAVCFAISAAYGDSDISAFGFSAIIALSLGMLLRYISRDASAVLTRYDSYVAVTVAWLSSTLIGMLPYILSGALPDVSDAFFETMSGFTTTGSTMIDDIDGDQLDRRPGHSALHAGHPALQRQRRDEAVCRRDYRPDEKQAPPTPQDHHPLALEHLSAAHGTLRHQPLLGRHGEV